MGDKECDPNGRELLMLAAHLLRNSASVVSMNAQTIRHGGSELPVDAVKVLWDRLQEHADAIAAVCAEMARNDVESALDNLARVAQLLKDSTPGYAREQSPPT